MESTGTGLVGAICKSPDDVWQAADVAMQDLTLMGVVTSPGGWKRKNLSGENRKMLDVKVKT
jgi:hypothetical protein